MKAAGVGFAIVFLLSAAACGDGLPAAGDGGAGGGGGGRADAGGPYPDAGNCAEVEVQVGPVTPTVMVLVDRSGSMTDPFGSGDGAPSKWQALYQTLMDGATGVIPVLEDQVRFGLATYSASDIDNDGTLEGECPDMDVVAPALGNAGAIDAVYQPLSPLDETPTGAAISAAAPVLAAAGNDDGPHILVLATDGEPDTCALPNPNGSDEGRAESLAAVQAAFQSGIHTYVVSVGGDAVGNEAAEEHMHELANAGEGLPLDADPPAPLYVALDPSELVGAFDTIINSVRTCHFMLMGHVDPGLAYTGRVTLDGTELTYGTEWQLLDETTLELLGGACDTVMAGGTHDIAAYFTCRAIVD